MRRTVEVAPGGPRPTIKLRPAPPCEPPFDDELDPQVWTTAHQLALDWSDPRRRPTEPVPPRPALQRTVVAGASADAKLAVRRFVHLCVEVLNGYRPPAHLRRLSLPAEAAAVVTQGIVGAQRVAAQRKASRAPGRRSARRAPPVAVVRLRMCEPRPGAVEAAVALVTGDRTWALALRLELHHDAWAATTMRLI